MTHGIVISLLANAAVFTALFGLMLAVRKLLAKRISAALQYVLWAAVIVKLMIPFGFESDLSPLLLLKQLKTPTAQAETGAEIPSDFSGDGMVLADDTPSSVVNEDILNDTGTAQIQASNTIQIPTVPTAVPLGWQDWALMAWAAGVLAVGTGQALLAAHLRRRSCRARQPVPERVRRMLEQRP